MAIEFADNHIPYEQDKWIQITYKGRTLIKKYRADFVCFDKIIVEIKALKNLTDLDVALLLNYLKATGYQLGLLINFGNTKLEWKRYVYTKKENLIV